MKNKKILSIVLIVALIAMVAVGAWYFINKSHAKEAANSAIETLNEKHYKGLNDLLVGDNSIDSLAEADPEIAALGFGSTGSDSADAGVFSCLLANADVKLKSINPFSKTVTFSVANTDFSTFFSDNLDAVCESEDDFTNLIIAHENTHEQSTADVRLTYEKTDSGIAIDFNSYEFLNAYFGGFMQSYSQEYYSGIETILEGGD